MYKRINLKLYFKNRLTNIPKWSPKKSTIQKPKLNREAKTKLQSIHRKATIQVGNASNATKYTTHHNHIASHAILECATITT